MKRILICLALLMFTVASQAQDFDEKLFAAFEFRGVGPAFTAGRISDIAIHPMNESIWYIAVGSGGVWKTENRGVTWAPIFDDQPVYSIGCITIDPNNPHTIWVGTGENVGGRHVSFGDGIYKSEDDGKSWKNMGLPNSNHISKIIVHPENSDIVWVAAQGPLWTSGGNRGLYKSTDGGTTWRKVLGEGEWTGVTDVVIDPNNTNWLYAATWDRHRTVAAYLGGGSGSGLHRSKDGGETWEALTSGIPKTNLGKIGLAISPFNPDVLYAAIEEDLRKGGIYMSANRGKTWTKQSDAVSGGTGPHYYQELYASPHHEGRLYLANNSMLVSDDHGKTYRVLDREGVHSDSHAIGFTSDPNYILLGTDGGLYQTYDLAQNWNFINNMPITQYYKVAVDDSEPFYYIYGGTQDNGSHGGPSRTPNSTGIRNSDWWKTLGGDGHQSAIEPGNPDITYAQSQHGVLHRIDQITREQVYIAPQPGEGEPEERYNWDAPILVSPHDPATIFYASSRVWMSENRGDSWTAISEDLTRKEERISLPIMGRLQSYENPWDFYAMSYYSTITSLAESPQQKGLIYAGTDDGLIQVTEDGGQNWTKIELSSVKGLPGRPFVNDVRADLFDVNTVYAALDNHKYGDFKPYLIKSIDKGKSWSLMSGNLPDKHLTWRLVQDHIDPKLLFVATEFGIFFTKDGGSQWIKLKSGVPTISFRDLTIQRREDDLVGASFGRSFYVLDDIAPLREMNASDLSLEAKLFTLRDAYWYDQYSAVGSQGSIYSAENPPYGATFTYYLKDTIKTKKVLRKEKEHALNKNNSNVPFPGWDTLEEEAWQEEPQIVLVVKDSNGKVVNRVVGKNKAGITRVSWDLSVSPQNVVELEESNRNWEFPAIPGIYTVSLNKVVDGVMTELSSPQSFEVKPLWKETALPPASKEEIAAFIASLEDYRQEMSHVAVDIDNSLKKAKAMKTALTRAKKPVGDLIKQLHDANKRLLKLNSQMNGNVAQNAIGADETSIPSPRSRFFYAARGASTTHGPTDTHKSSLEIGNKQLTSIRRELDDILDNVMPNLEQSMQEVGAPPIAAY
ncbi:MAG: glycosyl hydrolase [Bacteroidota bacterium]